MTSPTQPLCWTCKHLNENAPGMTCAAFPDGIPEPIILSDADHKKPYKGDNGIQYEPLEDGAPADPADS